MAYTTVDYIRSIRRYLAINRWEIESDNRRSKTDINHDAEYFYARLMNQVFDWKLVNENDNKKNTPAIDLIDRNKKIAIQVTSTDSRKKIQDTINKFRKYFPEEAREYRLIIFLLGETVNHTGKFDTEGVCSLEIWTYDNILNELSAKGDLNQLELIESFVNKELTGLFCKAPSLRSNYLSSDDPVIGREGILSRMEDELAQQGTMGKSRILFIKGIGGIGKSVLAKEYAREHMDDYDHIIEVSAFSSGSEKNGFASFCSFRNVIHKIPIENWNSSAIDEEAQYRDKLHLLGILTEANHVLLIVHDYNVSSDNDIAWGKLKCDILVTTRNDWDGEYRSITLDQRSLQRMEAAEIFTAYYTQRNPDNGRYLQGEEKKAVYGIVDRTFKYPLLLRLLAKQMTCVNGKPILPSVMLTELKNGILVGDNQTFQNSMERDGHTITLDQNMFKHLEAVFKISHSLTMLNNEQMEALRFLLMLREQEGISARRFTAWTGMDHQKLNTLSRGGWLEYYANGVDPMNSLIDENVIVERQYVEVRKKAGFFQRLFGHNRESEDQTPNSKKSENMARCPDGVYILPMPITEVLREQDEMRLQIQEMKQYLAAWRKVPYDRLSGIDTRRRFKEETRSIIANILEEDSAEYTSLLGDAGCILYQLVGSKADYEECKGMLEKALDHREPFFQEYDLRISRWYYTLGRVYWHLRERNEAISYLNSSMMIEKALKGDVNEEVAKCHDALAECYEDQGDHKEAFHHRNIALDMRVQLYGEDSLQTAISYRNIAASCWYRNENEKAITNICKAYGIQGIDDGEDDIERLKTRVRKGVYYLHSLNEEEGKAILEDALVRCFQVVGRTHTITEEVYKEIAHFYKKKKEYRTAIEQYLEAADICKIIYGDNHEETAEIYKRIGELYQLLNEMEEAENYFSEAKSMRTDATNFGEWLENRKEKDRDNLETLMQNLKKAEELYNESNPLVADCHQYLGDYYFKEKDYEKAFRHYEIELRILEKCYGEKNTAVLACLRRLCEKYNKIGQYKHAIHYCERGVKISEELNGQGSTTAWFYSHLGNLYQTMRKLEEAEKYYKKALEISKKINGEENLDTATAYSNLGNLYQTMGRMEEAGKCLQKALNISLKISGEKDASIGTKYNNLGGFYYNLGRLEEAEDYLQKAVKIFEKSSGEEDSNIELSYHNLGGLYQKMGRLEEAEEYYWKALNISMKVRGEEHPDIGITYKGLGIVYRTMGRLEEAEDCYRKAMKIFKKFFGEEHPSTKAICQELCILYYAMGRLEEAKEIL